MTSVVVPGRRLREQVARRAAPVPATRHEVVPRVAPLATSVNVEAPATGANASVIVRPERVTAGLMVPSGVAREDAALNGPVPAAFSARTLAR